MSNTSLTIEREVMTGGEECSCPRQKCERHGKCDECRAYLMGLKKPKTPFCERPDRSPFGI
jgi:hypothetical protein